VLVIYFHDKRMVLNWNPALVSDDIVTEVLEQSELKWAEYFGSNEISLLDGYGIRLQAVNIVINSVSPLFVRAKNPT